MNKNVAPQGRPYQASGDRYSLQLFGRLDADVVFGGPGVFRAPPNGSVMRGSNFNLIAPVNGHEEALQKVVAIRALPCDMQKEIELCGGL